ncbi:MAG: MFS transporter [Coleofasciculaceae cyanobacterium]
MSNINPSEPFPPNITTAKRLSLPTKLAYGAGDLGPAITANIGVFFALFFFTNVAGLSAGLAGSILMIGKIWDAINDPMIGVMSDRTKHPWGRRLPWMFYGAIPFGIFFFLQWIVPHFSADKTANNWALFWYYVVIGIFFNSFYTAVNLPYTALTPELTQDYNERTSLNSFRFTFSIGGSILSLILAQIIFAQLKVPQEQQYIVLAAVCAVFSVLPLFWCVWGVKNQVLAFEEQRRDVDEPVSVPLLEKLRIIFWNRAFLNALGIYLLFSLILQVIAAILSYFVSSWINLPEGVFSQAAWFIQGIVLSVVLLWFSFHNRAFLFVIGIYLCSWLGVQVTASILPYFVVNWMGLPAAEFPKVAIAVQGTALIMLFVWSAVSKRFGKKAVYFMGMIIWIIAQAGLFFLQPEQIGLMYFLATLAGVGVSTAYLIPWSMIPDVIELDELQTGQRREGIFYGFMVLLQKVGLAVGLFLVGQALEFSGFIETAPGQTAPIQPASALLAIRISIGPLPTIALILGLILAYFYPITKAVHAEILLKLQERKSGLSNAPSHPESLD